MRKAFFRPFRRLQWQLTFSYTWITMTTLLILILTSTVAVSEAAAVNFPHLVVDDLKTHAAELVPYLLVAPPDRAGIEKWFQQPANLTSQVDISSFPHMTYSVTLDDFTAVINPQGRVVASQGSTRPLTGTSLRQYLPGPARAVLQAALAGQTDITKLESTLSDNSAIAAYPLVGPYGRVEGALVAQTTGISQPIFLLHALLAALLFALPVTLLAALIGTIFGFLTGRTFHRRFKHLSLTAGQWGQGNFVALARDPSNDELGQLTRHLNHMARQLQALLSTHQKLAVLEERQRLARDLHDSIKQQVFAISMLVNSARGLLRSDLERAQTCLNETDAFVQHVQQELTSLVHALHPPVLEEKGLVAAVQELAAQWSYQSGIAMRVRVRGEPAPALIVAECMFRIAQEALANAARHSHATSVEIRLASEQDTLRLVITDNGQGFDYETERGRGVGLLSMQERIRLLAGTLRIDSVPGKGTHITACCSNPDPGE